MPRYTVNQAAFDRARELIERRQYILRSDWGERQPRAVDQNRFLKSHSWDEYAEWHLGLTGATPQAIPARLSRTWRSS